MGYPRRAATFRFSEQTHEILDTMVARTGLDRTAMLERLVRAEAVRASKTDSAIAGMLAKLPKDYREHVQIKRRAGRKVKAAPIAAPDVPPPPPATMQAAGLPRW